MPLNEPVPGLRRLFNGSKQPAKVSIVVAPGDAVEVSDDVAEQLQRASSAFTDGKPRPRPVPVEGHSEPPLPAEPKAADTAKPSRSRRRADG